MNPIVWGGLEKRLKGQEWYDSLKKAADEAKQTGQISQETQQRMANSGMTLPSNLQLQENAAALHEGRSSVNVNSPTGLWMGANAISKGNPAGVDTSVVQGLATPDQTARATQLANRARARGTQTDIQQPIQPPAQVTSTSTRRSANVPNAPPQTNLPTPRYFEPTQYQTPQDLQQYIKPMTDEELAQYAQLLADLQIDPQRQEIERQLERALLDAQLNAESIYGPIFERTLRLMDEGARRGYDLLVDQTQAQRGPNAIFSPLGRGEFANYWQSANEDRNTALLQQNMLADQLARQYALQEEQMREELVDLESRRGQLNAAERDRLTLLRQQLAMAQDEQGFARNLAQNQLQMAANAQNFGQDFDIAQFAEAMRQFQADYGLRQQELQDQLLTSALGRRVTEQMLPEQLRGMRLSNDAANEELYRGMETWRQLGTAPAIAQYQMLQQQLLNQQLQNQYYPQYIQAQIQQMQQARQGGGGWGPFGLSPQQAFEQQTGIINDFSGIRKRFEDQLAGGADPRQVQREWERTNQTLLKQWVDAGLPPQQYFVYTGQGSLLNLLDPQALAQGQIRYLPAPENPRPGWEEHPNTSGTSGAPDPLSGLFNDYLQMPQGVNPFGRLYW